MRRRGALLAIMATMHTRDSEAEALLNEIALGNKNYDFNVKEIVRPVVSSIENMGLCHNDTSIG